MPRTILHAVEFSTRVKLVVVPYTTGTSGRHRLIWIVNIRALRQPLHYERTRFKTAGDMTKTGRVRLSALKSMHPSIS